MTTGINGVTVGLYRRAAFSYSFFALKICCIPCGNMASIRKQDDLKVVSRPFCQRENERDTYQEMFDQWIDKIRKED